VHDVVSWLPTPGLECTLRIWCGLLSGYVAASVSSTNNNHVNTCITTAGSASRSYGEPSPSYAHRRHDADGARSALNKNHSPYRGDSYLSGGGRDYNYSASQTDGYGPRNNGLSEGRGDAYSSEYFSDGDRLNLSHGSNGSTGHDRYSRNLYAACILRQQAGRGQCTDASVVILMVFYRRP
jgi:hypothetical protein